ncbi:MAG: BadF/BadG/BcrA/BcrD ATPase family protein [Pyrinomonadaceae bacterium]
MSAKLPPIDLPHRPLPTRDFVVGVDGGGSKTRAVVLDSEQRVVGEGAAGPSNPLRVGITTAATAVRDAVDKASNAASIKRHEIAAIGIGLAGVRRKDIRARMREALSATLGIKQIELVSDGDIALYGATDGQPGIVVIAGTGSISCGVNRQGKRVCAGGWGPVVGDEGGGSWIARRALQAVAHESDERGPKTILTDAACAYFHVGLPEDLSTAIYAPTITNERLAGFAKYVIEAARSGDAVARGIMIDAGKELGKSTIAVMRKLHMENERFQVAYVGGVFAAGEMILAPLRDEIVRVAKKAFIAPPSSSPTIAAARLARALLTDLALAV